MRTPERTDPAGGMLIQFAKWPEYGRVKTRLAAVIGADQALEAHLLLTRAVLDNLVASGYPLAFWWDRPQPPSVSHAHELLERLCTLGVPQFSQEGVDLGARMAHALSSGLAQAPKALIVGSDCPSVDSGYIQQAYAALDKVDVVLGPSDDGGFVLIGARRDLGDTLTGIEWGTASVLGQTLAALSDAGFSVRQLANRWDVDDVTDWQRFLAGRFAS
ncbi:glycosyltransferase [Marinobacter halodurans]|uniref:Glycosyltransferase n=1 Tax=Marinobacter halodurans TaxID=2528979 RepID=A0ABY1ZLL4_9GAMM|nr:TIGR04282 family arsenosugar biosynthesis glycosyltransferase [Marinobacter halodurans]TBW56658.1 glycosyltransferase [Marinobacter halodurans]